MSSSLHDGALQPFAAEPHLAGLRLQGRAHWQNGCLSLDYRLQGPLEALRLPERQPQPQRLDGLWQSTCFEAFIAIPEQQGYWELNLSPSGDWNAYALSAYRHNLRQEERIQALPFVSERSDGRSAPPQLRLMLTLELNGLVSPAAALQISMTAVLDHRQFGCSYWAWQHSGPQADFHRRDSFLTL